MRGSQWEYILEDSEGEMVETVKGKVALLMDSIHIRRGRGDGP